MIPLTISSEASTPSDTERISDIRFSEWGFTDGAQNGIFASDNGNNLINETPTSTPADKPSATPAESYPSSTSVDGGNLPKPSS